MVLQEVYDRVLINFAQWDGFDPASEVISCNQNILVLQGRIRLYLPNNIQPPLLEWLCDHHRLQWCGCFRLSSTTPLTNVTFPDMGMYILKKRGPIVTGSENFVSYSIS